MVKGLDFGSSFSLSTVFLMSVVFLSIWFYGPTRLSGVKPLFIK